MSGGLTFLLGAAIGLLVGVAGSIAFAFSERSRTESAVEHEDNPTVSDARALLAAIPQGHLVVEPDDRVFEAGSRAYSYGLVRGREVLAEILDIVKDVREHGEIADLELRLRKSAMEEAGDRRLWLRAAPVSGNRVLVLFEDNTERKRLEETRRDFVANVSHELKTPVGAIGLLAETLQEVADEPEHVRKFSQKLVVEARRLSDLVREIIELSRLQDGDSLAASEIVDIDAVVNEAVDRIRIEADARSVNLVTGGTKGLKVYGDRAHLTTAVRNLLDNAVRYSRAQSRVSVGVSELDGEVHIAVVDQGEGIPAKIRDRIFERFYRGDRARSRETGGSGLGLSIVKHVVADHGGRIKLWSEPGHGATFTVILPVAKPDEEQNPGTSAASHAKVDSKN